MDEYQLRLVKMADASTLASIYRPYVEKTPITFEYEAPDAKEFQRRIGKTLGMFPYLVCESSQDGVIGYAYGSNLYDRAAYRWDTELSIYLSQSHRGKGIGSALYRGLLGLLKLQGYCKAYACITYPNDESVKFHQNFGFKQCGYFQQSGFKLGQWHDVIWMDKPLISTGYHSAPGVLKYVDSLDQEVVAAILVQAIKGNDLGY